MKKTYLLMKSQILTTATLLITITLSSLPAFANPKADMATLNTQLQTTMCNEDWEASVKIVDQMISITPSTDIKQRYELKEYRGRLQNLIASRTNADSWLASFCSNRAATPAISNTSTTSSMSLERRFLEAYQQGIMKLNISSDAKSLLLDRASESPYKVVAEAKAACKALRSGLSPEEMVAVQVTVAANASTILSQEAFMANASLRNIVGSRYYCPEFLSAWSRAYGL